MADTETSVRHFLLLFRVPFVHPVHPFIYFHLVVPSQVMQLRHVRKFPHRAVRLRCIPSYFPFETYFLFDQHRHVVNAQFLARTHVDMAVSDILVTFLISVLEIHIQQHMHAGVCHFLAPQELSHRFSRAPQHHVVIVDAVFCQNCYDVSFRRISVHTFHRTLLQVSPYSLHITVHQTFCQMDLSYHGRQHMASFQVEIIVRTIQVSRHHRYIVCAILQIEALTHLQSRNLSYGIRFVGIFQRGGEQHFLLHRLFRIPRIDTCTSQEQQLLHPVTEAFAYHVLLYLQIVVYKVSSVDRVRHYTAHMSGSQNHRIRFFLVEEFLHSHPVQQIQFLVSPSHKICISPLQKIVPDGRTHQSAVSCHIYFRVLF